jgi:glycosyltransferase involved in cell wall biosynthesis
VSRTKVALWLPTLWGGGAQRSFLTLSGLLHRAGYEVDLVVGSARGALAGEVPPEIRLVDFGRDRLQRALPDLVGYLRRARPACLIGTIDHASVLAVLAVRIARSGTPVVVRAANTTTVQAARARKPTDRLTFALARRLYPLADALIAPSSGAADDLAQFAGVDPASVRTLPNPIVGPELDGLAAAPVDHPFFVPGEPPVVLAVGRIAAQKDYPTLLAAFAEVRRRRPVRLIILGEARDPRERGALIARMMELGLRPEVDVSLPGFDPNPFRYMRRARLVVLSSTHEGLPGVLIQALACGTEVVATDCPSGPREILDGGRHGTLVPVGAPAALAAAIGDVLARPPRPPAPASWAPYTHAASLASYTALIETITGTSSEQPRSATAAGLFARSVVVPAGAARSRHNATPAAGQTRHKPAQLP